MSFQKVFYGVMNYPCSLVRISEDPDITNGNIQGDTTVEFKVAAADSSLSEVWVGGWTGFDDSDLQGFACMSDALEYALRGLEDVDASVKSQLLQTGRCFRGDNDQDYKDILLFHVTF